MTLATDLTSEWVGGWFASEKLNGCRAFWDGEQFWTRGGNIIKAPNWFTKGFPKIALDGEIWAGRDGVFSARSFQTARVAVQNGGDWFYEVSPSGHPIQFTAFDAPNVSGRWDIRMKEVIRSLRTAVHGVAIPFHKVLDGKRWVEFLAHVRRLGGEGAMFRNPEILSYEFGRTPNLLRFKFCE